MSLPVKVEWLQQVLQTYSQLSDEDRNIVLDSLIETSGVRIKNVFDLNNFTLSSC